jgi:hypothetical protein
VGGDAPISDEGQAFAGVDVSGGNAEQDVAIVEVTLR